jgi:hypothetical protein
MNDDTLTDQQLEDAFNIGMRLASAVKRGDVPEGLSDSKMMWLLDLMRNGYRFEAEMTKQEIINSNLGIR